MTATRTADAQLPADWPLWTGLLTAELLAVGTYLFTSGGISEPRYVLYPFLWINVGLYALIRARRPRASGRRRALAASVAAVYGIALAVVTGLVGLPLFEHAHSHPNGWQLTLSAPGWGPRIAYVLGEFHLYFVPYRVVGYVALSYLLYAGLADRSKASSAGLLGLLSCVGCSFPLLTSVVAGTSAAALSGVSGYSLDLSTVAFLAAMALLWWPQTRD